MNWWDWLLCSSKELELRGCNPKDRVIHTGHRRALSFRWAQSIGSWGRLEPLDIMNKVFAPVTIDDKKKARMCFDLFLNRHSLFSRKTWMDRFTTSSDVKSFMVVGRVMIATYAHSRIHLHMLRNPKLCPGTAAEIGVLREYTTAVSEEDRLGILPIEAVLYYWSIQYILEQTGISYDSWVDGTGETTWLARAQHWNDHCTDFVTLPAEAFEKYAGRNA